MKVVIPRERGDGERRVAATPASVGSLVETGLEVVVESGAGHYAHADDSAYREAGAAVAEGDQIDTADVVLSVRPLEAERAARLRKGAITAGLLAPTEALDTVRALRDRHVTAFSLELLPRISRAQSMDALSSQALVAGYRAVLIAAERLPRFFPMFMTAAGTVPPARVLVLGAGVAGLQAIATARRLGGVVEAYDVRAAAAEEVRSLGATFLELELETQEGAGGYAGAQSEDFQRRQRQMVGEHVASAEAVITTAAVPGKRAPLLVTTDMVDGMAPGSVVVDLAAETGGNCELTRAGEELWRGEVLVHGARNLPSSVPADASRLYAKNVANLLLSMTDGGEVRPDFDDEVVAGCCLTHAGEVRHGPTQELLDAASASGEPEAG